MLRIGARDSRSLFAGAFDIQRLASLLALEQPRARIDLRPFILEQLVNA